MLPAIVVDRTTVPVVSFHITCGLIDHGNCDLVGRPQSPCGPKLLWSLIVFRRTTERLTRRPMATAPRFRRVTTSAICWWMTSLCPATATAPAMRTNRAYLRRAKRVCVTIGLDPNPVRGSFSQLRPNRVRLTPTAAPTAVYPPSVASQSLSQP